MRLTSLLGLFWNSWSVVTGNFLVSFRASSQALRRDTALMIVSCLQPTSRPRHFVNSIEGRTTTLRTDHRPSLFMFFQKVEKLIARQARHVAFLSQLIHDVEHVSGKSNVVPDALSRLELATLAI